MFVAFICSATRCRSISPAGLTIHFLIVRVCVDPVWFAKRTKYVTTIPGLKLPRVHANALGLCPFGLFCGEVLAEKTRMQIRACTLRFFGSRCCVSVYAST